ncbi:hypothetical protein [Streptomyces sp. NPDC006134]|uniref:hypothetical protein n=1 Tax=Streptomyces sp. NPDC006134 TaxID=3154467 RepID=UPI003402F2B1
MPTFQTGSIPHGFTVDETGKLIHYKNAVVVPTPPPNHSGFNWKNLWFSLGSDFADVRIRVATHTGSGWTVKNYDVQASGGRVGFQVPDGTDKISVGRVKLSASDANDDSPVSWLLESQA